MFPLNLWKKELAALTLGILKQRPKDGSTHCFSRAGGGRGHTKVAPFASSSYLPLTIDKAWNGL